jgi:anti-anti-sigma factor
MFIKDSTSDSLLANYNIMYRVTETTEITLRNCKDLAYDLAIQILEYKPNILVLNLSNIMYCDSSGMGSLLGALTASRKHNCDLILLGVTSQVKRLFRLCTIDTLFLQIASLDEITRIDL